MIRIFKNVTNTPIHDSKVCDGIAARILKQLPHSDHDRMLRRVAHEQIIHAMHKCPISWFTKKQHNISSLLHSQLPFHLAYHNTFKLDSNIVRAGTKMSYGSANKVFATSRIELSIAHMSDQPLDGDIGSYNKAQALAFEYNNVVRNKDSICSRGMFVPLNITQHCLSRMYQRIDDNTHQNIMHNILECVKTSLLFDFNKQSLVDKIIKLQSSPTFFIPTKHGIFICDLVLDANHAESDDLVYRLTARTFVTKQMLSEHQLEQYNNLYPLNPQFFTQWEHVGAYICNLASLDIISAQRAPGLLDKQHHRITLLHNALDPVEYSITRPYEVFVV